MICDKKYILDVLFRGPKILGLSCDKNGKGGKKKKNGKGVFVMLMKLFPECP